MDTARRVRRAARTLGLLGVLVAAGPGVSLASDHPTLVNIDSTLCSNCHEELQEGRAVVHAPVADDCVTCHDFTVADEGTSVSLIADEPELCLSCHDDPSARDGEPVANPHAPVSDSCLTCHDAHAGEIEFLLHSAPVELCSGCHDRSELDETHGGQITDATRCTQCHDAHGSPNDSMLVAGRQHRPFADGSCSGCHRQPFGDRIRLRSRGEKLCTACHGAFERPEGGTLHEAIEGERGRAGCLNCHDPHMSDHAAVTRRSGSDLCEDCHDPIVEAARADGGHAPAADDCATCHQPHLSGEQHLLSMPADELCLACHDVEETEFAAAHLGARLEGGDCVACHDPHGSGNPSLLARNLHAPITEGCDTCHEGNAAQLIADGESELCLVCHDSVGESAEAAAVRHGAMELATCSDCHNPHASAQNRLIREPGGAVCTACHDEQAAGPDEVAHGVIDLIGCQACHEPHGGSRELLLRDEVDALCRSCHDSDSVPDRFELPADVASRMASLRLSEDKTSGHPVPDHRVAGVPTRSELKRTDVTFEGELHCTTCHDPHKGRSRFVFRWDVASPSEACVECHPK